MNQVFDELWAGVMANHFDQAPRLILADWLDENGDESLANGLRTSLKHFPCWIVKCKYRSGKRKTTWLLQQLREHAKAEAICGLLTQGPRVMSLTYTNGATYKGKIVKWGLSESKAKKTPQIYFTVLIENEVDAKGVEFDCPAN